MVYYGDIRFSEAWSMPIPIRKWWIERVSRERAKAAGTETGEHVDPFGRKGGRMK